MTGCSCGHSAVASVKPKSDAGPWSLHGHMGKAETTKRTDSPLHGDPQGGSRHGVRPEFVFMEWNGTKLLACFQNFVLGAYRL